MPDAALPRPREAADSVSPGRLRFAINASDGSHPYYVDDSSAATLEAYVNDLLGYNREPDPIDGTIRRALPRRHPRAPNLVVANVEEVGYGVPSAAGEAAVEGFLGLGNLPVVDRTAVYPHATITVSYHQPPYDLLADEIIDVENAVVYDEDGRERRIKYATEQTRFVRVKETFDPKIMTAQQGSLMFVTRAQAGPPTDPHGIGFPGSPRLDYPEFALEVTHYQIPYRWLWSRRSYYKRLANTVNQLPITIENYSFLPGELMYVGYTYEDYWPPFSASVLVGDVRTALTFSKWINVTLRFQVAYREAADPPASPNPAFIWDRGHNTLPSFTDRRAHPVVSFNSNNRADSRYWRPLFGSSAHQLLFTDPDLPQPEPVNRLGEMHLGKADPTF